MTNLTNDFQIVTQDNASGPLNEVIAQLDEMLAENAEPGIRLDNTNSLVIDWLELDFDPNNPGATPPADCCLDCVRVQFHDDDILDFEIDHPPYSDGEYTCAVCDVPLKDYHRDIIE